MSSNVTMKILEMIRKHSFTQDCVNLEDERGELNTSA